MEKKIIFGVFSLRVSVLNLAFGFFGLAWSIFLINITDFKEYKVGTVIAVLFAFLSVITWSTVLYAAHKVSYFALTVSLVIWSMSIALWIMTVLVSFVDVNGVTLVNQRGPESLWIVTNTHNLDLFTTNYDDYEQPMDFQQHNQLSPPVTRFLHIENVWDTKLTKWLLIILCLITSTCFITSSWYVLFSFAQEMEYELKCICPDICNSGTNDEMVESVGPRQMQENIPIV